jgi:fatty-acyl-CoA synthase/long-chain acyl-CoA synthetase
MSTQVESVSSLSRSASDPQLDVHGEGMTVSAQVARHARSRPQALALTYGDLRFSYAQLHEQASRFANVLIDRGVRARDRVAVLAVNGPEYLSAYVACARVGAVCVPINFRLTVPEVAYQIRHSGASVVVADQALVATAAEASRGLDVSALLVIGGDGGGVQFTGEVTSLAAALEAAPATYAEHPIDEDGPAVIMYTSGTTGSPKGALLSHRSLHTGLVAKALDTGIPVHCRTWLVGTPLFHIAGLMSCLNPLYLGGTIVLQGSGAFDATQAIEVLERERINAAFFVPSQWREIVRSPAVEGRDFSALLLATWGGEPATPQLVREIIQAFPRTAVSTVFGQTEVSATATLLLGEDAVQRPGSVGRPMLHVECRLVDDDMNDVPAGAVGEIVYRGPTVMLGYWNDPERTAEAFRGGWFHSGDLLRADDDGYLYVVDRKKDMIISGGENVYCAEVESVVAGHPKVGRVAVIGIPHERWGEVPLAVIVPRGDAHPDAADIEDFTRRRLAAYKVPRRIAVVDELPLNASGKVRKDVLRRIFTGIGAA